MAWRRASVPSLPSRASHRRASWIRPGSRLLRTGCPRSSRTDLARQTRTTATITAKNQSAITASTRKVARFMAAPPSRRNAQVHRWTQSAIWGEAASDGGRKPHSVASADRSAFYDPGSQPGVKQTLEDFLTPEQSDQVLAGFAVFLALALDLANAEATADEVG